MSNMYCSMLFLNMVDRQIDYQLKTGVISPILLEDEHGIFIYDFVTKLRTTVVAADEYKYWNNNGTTIHIPLKFDFDNNGNPIKLFENESL